MHADGLLAKVYDFIFAHIGRHAHDVHKFHLEATVWMLQTADLHGVAVYQGEHVELFSARILLTAGLEFQAAQ